MALVEVRGLTKEYERKQGGMVRVVDGVSFDIERGETMGLVGESGSGKTTVARMVVRLVEATAGEVRFEGQDILRAGRGEMRRLRRHMQIVFQDPVASLDSRMRIETIVTEPLVVHAGESGVAGSRAERRERARELMEQVGLEAAVLRRFPHELSGGQRQRVSIARALALKPKLVVLDEPVSALDVSVGAQVVNLLRDLQREMGLTYLFISHSMPLVRYLATRVVVLRQGKVVEEGEVEEVCRRPREEYTRELIAATPELPVNAGG
jgi:ABC-type glutathione transport system ATPase component